MKCDKSILTKLGQEIPVLEKQEGQLRGGFLLLKTDEVAYSEEEGSNTNKNKKQCICLCLNTKKCLTTSSSTDTTSPDGSNGFVPSMII